MRTALVERLVAAVENVTSGFLIKARSSTIIIGVNARTRLLAAELEAAGRETTLIAENRENVNASDALAALLDRAGSGAAMSLVAATSSDSLNLTLCRMARDRFGVPLVITRMRLLECVTSWARLNEFGMSRMSWAEVVSIVLGDVTPRQSFIRIARASDEELVAEVEMLSVAFVGQTVTALPLRGCEAVALRRRDSLIPGFQIVGMHLSDVITLIGRKAAIDHVRESLMSL
jgi:Trk K+ transport system NAD-binding subunit